MRCKNKQIIPQYLIPFKVYAFICKALTYYNLLNVLVSERFVLACRNAKKKDRV